MGRGGPGGRRAAARRDARRGRGAGYRPRARHRPRERWPTSAAAGRGSAGRSAAGGSWPRCSRCWGSWPRRCRWSRSTAARCSPASWPPPPPAPSPASRRAGRPPTSRSAPSWRSPPGAPIRSTRRRAPRSPPSYLALQSAEVELVNVAPATVIRARSRQVTPRSPWGRRSRSRSPAIGRATGAQRGAARHRTRPGARPQPRRPPARRRGTGPGRCPPPRPGRPGRAAHPVRLRSAGGGAPLRPGRDALDVAELDAAGAVTMRVRDLRSDTEVPHRLGVLSPDTLAAWLTPDRDLVLVRTGEASAAAAETRLVAPVARRRRRGRGDAAVVGRRAGRGRGRDLRAGRDRPPGGDGDPGRSGRGSAAGPDPGHVMPEPDLRRRRRADRDPSGIARRRPACGSPISGAGRRTSSTCPRASSPRVRRRDSPWSPPSPRPGRLDRPVLLAAHHGSVLRMTTRPVLPDEVGGQGAVRTASDDGRYIMTRGGDTLLVEDPGTGEQLAALPGVVGDRSKVGFGSEIWVFDAEPDGCRRHPLRGGHAAPHSLLPSARLGRPHAHVQRALSPDRTSPPSTSRPPPACGS